MYTSNAHIREPLLTWGRAMAAAAHSAVCIWAWGDLLPPSRSLCYVSHTSVNVKGLRSVIATTRHLGRRPRTEARHMRSHSDTKCWRGGGPHAPHTLSVIHRRQLRRRLHLLNWIFARREREKKNWQEMCGEGETAKKLKACKTETSERFTAHRAETALLLDITSAS